ncbi:hypothetical protein FRX31_007044 [Thalictrum thalictroides]|uniref:Uncharacterized protein n=1 Tax=Thalictrum thalictroides TaxID=46969 RepID=A0A7J6X0W6_THATH|nr:hypothetical protein FRX31_007044 [Thalictrum thalictroides]
MSDNAIDSQNLSERDDPIEDNDVSVSGGDSIKVDNLVDGDADGDNAPDQNEARVAFQYISDAYNIKITDLEMFRIGSRFYYLGGDTTPTMICEGQLKDGMRLPLLKFLCDVLNFFDRTPIHMSSSFWTIMLIFEKLNKLPRYNICLGDVVVYYRCFVGHSGDYVTSLKKQTGIGYKLYNPPQSNDGVKNTSVFRIKGSIADFASKKVHVEPMDIISIKKFAALSLAEKRKLLPTMEKWFKEQKAKQAIIPGTFKPKRSKKKNLLVSKLFLEESGDFPIVSISANPMGPRKADVRMKKASGSKYSFKVVYAD